MQTFNPWCQFHLCSIKVVLVLSLLVFTTGAKAQLFSKRSGKNNIAYDDRKYTFGFQLGIHSSAYYVKYDEQFVSPDLDTLHSIIAPFKPGFTFGFLVNRRLNEFFDLRIMPQATFYDFKLVYRYTNNTSLSQLAEATLLELPILIKYKSIRRKNARMYMLAGVMPSFQLSGKRSAESTSVTLPVSKRNISVSTGLGVDLYYPLFKLSIEARFSKGLVNMLQSRNSAFAYPLKKLSTNSFELYFIFQ